MYLDYIVCKKWFCLKRVWGGVSKCYMQDNVEGYAHLPSEDAAQGLNLEWESPLWDAPLKPSALSSKCIISNSGKCPRLYPLSLYRYGLKIWWSVREASGFWQRCEICRAKIKSHMGFSLSREGEGWASRHENKTGQLDVSCERDNTFLFSKILWYNILFSTET